MAEILITSMILTLNLRRSRNPNSILNRLHRLQQPPPQGRTFRSPLKHSRANSGGVASLRSSSPHPSPSPPPTSGIPSRQTEPQRPFDPSESPYVQDPMAGIRSHFAEIGRNFKIELSPVWIREGLPREGSDRLRDRCD